MKYQEQKSSSKNHDLQSQSSLSESKNQPSSPIIGEHRSGQSEHQVLSHQNSQSEPKGSDIENAKSDNKIEGEKESQHQKQEGEQKMSRSSPPQEVVGIAPLGEEEKRRLLHPQRDYLVDELYSVRQDSIAKSNNQIYRKLTKSFYRIKELKNSSLNPNGQSRLAEEYDYEGDSGRKRIKKVREMFNACTKSNMIVKKKIDKMRGKVDRIRSEIESSEYTLTKEVDFNKTYMKNHQNVSSGVHSHK